MLPKVGTCSQDNTIPQFRGRRKICVQIRQPLTHDLAVALPELRFEDAEMTNVFDAEILAGLRDYEPLGRDLGTSLFLGPLFRGSARVS